VLNDQFTSFITISGQFGKTCADLMEQLVLNDQFTSFITISGQFGNVNALADKGTMKPLSCWSYYSAQTP
jgi:hypothetical protein